MNKAPEPRLAGLENLARLESKLRRNVAALQYLLDRKLTLTTIRKFHLGIKEPYRRKTDGRVIRNALCYPLISVAGEPVGRYSCYSIPNVTENAFDDNWGWGRPATYHSGPLLGSKTLLVSNSCLELWVIDQHLRGTSLEGEVGIICPSHGFEAPDEWKDTEFWSGWSKVYFVHGGSDASERVAAQLLRLCGREIFHLRVPEGLGRSWAEFFQFGGTSEQFLKLLGDAPVLSGPVPGLKGAPDEPGEFAADPVNINGAYVNGQLYYPFTVERREVECIQIRGRGVERLVTSYTTKVVRSDGSVLDIIRLPAPRGTPRERQVLALTDGTRIEKEPKPSYYATWQVESIRSYIVDMQNKHRATHRPLDRLLQEVIAHLRHCVWLPHEDDYTVLALYVVLSYVYQVFEAIPLLLISGEKGTGKSELGDAISRVSCNAAVIGQGSAASVIRLMNEARGLIVLDDLESVGRLLEDNAFGDINQMLKLGYKKRTGRKAITDKNGKTTIFDFYGPKVINNTRGVDPVLGSRMLRFRTRRLPDTTIESVRLTGSDPDELTRLRDELHIWAMANAARVYEHYARITDYKADRQKEITAPLLALAELLNSDAIRDSLGRTLERQFTRVKKFESPVELLKEAVSRCASQGMTKRLSAAQITLELRLLADENPDLSFNQETPVWQRSEWVGHQLRILQLRDPVRKVGRVRLYGIITRIYDLNSEYVLKLTDDSLAGDSSPPVRGSALSFCEQTLCSECPYDNICATTIRGLQTNKMLNKGKSGRKASPLSDQ